MSILVINAGSSSIKIGIFNSTSKKITQTHSGFVDWEEKHPSFSLSLNGRREKKLLLDKKNRQACLKDLFEHLQTLFPVFKCIGHRVVHGGDYFSKPTRINSNVKRKIKDLKNLAPMHNPIELLCIDLAERTWEKTPNFAVFDTAFFRQISEISSLYPLPYRFKQKKIKRYGFHGINHEYCVNEVYKRLKKRAKPFKIITCHLGNGCSVSASLNNKCVDTSMGFTPLDGVMMGTRPGSLDPGILLYLLKNKTYSLKELEYILNHESGILGISGLSENMREIIKKKSKNSRAKLAFEMFISSIAKKIASLMTTLEGCEHLVFTGGIGENSPEVRQNIVKKLSYLGLKLDSKKNKTPALNSKISTSISKISVWVFAASEEKSIAQQCDILSN